MLTRCAIRVLFSTPDRGRRAPSNVEVMRAPVHDDGEIEAVVERLAAAPNCALLVPSDTFTWFRSSMIVALAAKNWLPAIYSFRRFVADGGLVDYLDPYELVRSAASYVDRIIKGAKPGDPPVAADQVYAGDQSQNRQSAWPRNSSQCACTRRRGDRMIRLQKCIADILLRHTARRPIGSNARRGAAVGGELRQAAGVVGRAAAG